MEKSDSKFTFGGFDDDKNLNEDFTKLPRMDSIFQKNEAPNVPIKNTSILDPLTFNVSVTKGTESIEERFKNENNKKNYNQIPFQKPKEENKIVVVHASEIDPISVDKLKDFLIKLFANEKIETIPKFSKLEFKLLSSLFDRKFGSKNEIK